MLNNITESRQPLHKVMIDRLLKFSKRNYLKLISLFVLIVMVFVIIAIVKSSQVYVPSRSSYNKENFIAKDDYKEKQIVLSNKRFTFTLDTNNTHFTLYDEKNDRTWYSRPEGDISSMTNDMRELFVLYYERALESPKAMSVNLESIRHGNYSFRVDEDSIEVLYVIGGKHGVTKDDLPPRLPVDKFENRLLPQLQEIAENDATVRRNLRLFTSQYVLHSTDKESYYYLRNIDSSDGIQMLYDLLFVHGGYTEEDFAEDGIELGFEPPQAPASFEFSVKYQLTDQGLDFRLINDSIYETPGFDVAYIDILPNFASGNIDSKGHIMIPDGSGVLIDFNNNKYSALYYNRRIYGSDYAINSTSAKLPEAREDILMPLYGMNNNDNGFIHTVEEGAAMTYLRAGFKTEYSQSELNKKNPYAHYRYYIRERDAYMFTGIGNDQKITVWTNQYNKEDFHSQIKFMDENQDQGYVGMAQLYQSHLINKGILTQGKDQTKKTTFNLTLLGGYKTTKHFLGIPYQKVESLTNSKQAKTILEELLASDVENINLSYQGWANDGLKPTAMSTIDFNKVVGSKNDFKELARFASSNEHITFIPEIYAQTAYTKKGIKVKQQSIYDMFWNAVVRHDFNLATTLPDRNTTPIYTLKSNQTQNYLEKITKNYKDLGFTSIGFIDFGNQLNSSFHKKDVVFKNDSLLYFENTMDSISNNYEHIMIRQPHQYALPYATYVLDLPTVGTEYTIVDQTIPFVQLVLSGYLDYSGNAFNMDDSRSLDWHKLKAIETGSNINFMWSFNNTIDLTQTEYSHYYSTYYKNWIDLAVETYHELNDLNIHGGKLIDHKLMNKSGTIVQVRYSNGLTIEINYNDLSYKVLSGEGN